MRESETISSVSDVLCKCQSACVCVWGACGITSTCTCTLQVAKCKPRFESLGKSYQNGQKGNREEGTMISCRKGKITI